MTHPNNISAYCRIKAGKISVDNHTVFESEDNFFEEFSKAAYKSLAINYPKFFKMDNLSKLAFLGAELLLRDRIDKNVENDIALLLSNKSSSLDTDVTYQNSIANKKDYYPSPAVFVYTLPNICLGEISIRHQLKSENSFFIFEAFNPEFMANYARILRNTGKAESVLCGWVELMGQSYDAFFYLVGPEGTIAQTPQNLETLYNK